MMKRPSKPRDAGARQIAALHHDHRVGVGVGRHLGRDLDAIQAGEVVVVVGRGVGVDDARLLAERVEREGHRQLRADGVAVGPRVRGDQEALPGSGSRRESARPGTLRSRRRRCAVWRRITHRGSARCGRARRGGSRPASPSAPVARSALMSLRIRSMRSLPLDRFVEEELEHRAPASAAAGCRSGGAGTASPARARATSRAGPSRRRASCSRRGRAAGPARLDVRDRQEADARVVHFAGEEIRRSPRGADRRRVTGACRRPSYDRASATLSTTNTSMTSPTLMSLNLLEADAALEPGLDLRDVVLEAAQRADLAFVDHDVVAEQPRLRVARRA